VIRALQPRSRAAEQFALQQPSGRQ